MRPPTPEPGLSMTQHPLAAVPWAQYHSTTSLQSSLQEVPLLPVAQPPGAHSSRTRLRNSFSSRDLERAMLRSDPPPEEILEPMRPEPRQNPPTVKSTTRYAPISDPIEDKSKLVNWHGDNDPERPINMSFWRKWAIVVTTGLMTFGVTFGSSIYSSTTSVLARKFGVSDEVMILGLSLYVLGFALGPMVWGPLSEVLGRTRPLWIGMVGFMAFLVPNAVAYNLQTIMICRFFAGAFGSAPLGIIGGMFVDFLSPADRGIATAVFSSAVLSGPAMGPLVGAFITNSYLGWRWTAYITLIMTAFFTAIAWLITPETFEPTLLRRRARALRYATHDWALHSKSEETPLDASALVSKYLSKPLVMIVKEPILIIVTLYISLVYGILYLSFEAFPVSFQGDRHWKPQLAGLTFLSIFIGCIGAGVFTAVFSRTWYARRVAANGGKLCPEHRMPIMMLGAVLLPIGLFWFAWTSHPGTHWAAQVLAGVPIGAGIVLVFQGCIVYTIDVYLMNANSAIAISTLVRSLFGAVFPLFAPYMYDNLGVDWATSLLGFLCVALVPFPWICWYYGERIRGWSKFAIVL